MPVLALEGATRIFIHELRNDADEVPQHMLMHSAALFESLHLRDIVNFVSSQSAVELTNLLQSVPRLCFAQKRLQLVPQDTRKLFLAV